jgi:mono/diheme cytochrome c family protein
MTSKQSPVENPSHAAPERELGPPAAVGHILAAFGPRQRTHRLADLVPRLEPRIVISDDPYYQRVKRFWAVPASAVLEELFGKDTEALFGSQFVVQAKDGYSVHIPGSKILAPYCYFAFSDADHRHFQPITEQQADPSPLYLIWEGERGDLKEFPRPWAVASIERVAPGVGLERTVPPDGFGDNEKAKRGDELFKLECIRCHSINQQGGRVGPDLNVPQNILAYRPEDQVRAYITNPKVFRYSSMPPHPDLTEEDLDALVAYLRLMGQHQMDPQVDVTAETAHEHD